MVQARPEPMVLLDPTGSQATARQPVPLVLRVRTDPTDRIQSQAPPVRTAQPGRTVRPEPMARSAPMALRVEPAQPVPTVPQVQTVRAAQPERMVALESLAPWVPMALPALTVRKVEPEPTEQPDSLVQTVPTEPTAMRAMTAWGHLTVSPEMLPQCRTESMGSEPQTAWLDPTVWQDRWERRVSPVALPEPAASAESE